MKRGGEFHLPFFCDLFFKVSKRINSIEQVEIDSDSQPQIAAII